MKTSFSIVAVDYLTCWYD